MSSVSHMVTPTNINKEGGVNFKDGMFAFSRGQLRTQYGPNDGSEPTRAPSAGSSCSQGGRGDTAPAAGAPAEQGKQAADAAEQGKQAADEAADAAEINADGGEEAQAGGSRAPLSGDLAAGGNVEPDSERRFLGSRRLHRWSTTIVGPPTPKGSHAPAAAGQVVARERAILGGSGRNAAVHAAEWENVIEISAEVWGRTYYLKAQSGEDCDRWVAALQEAKEEAEAAHLRSLHPTRVARAKQWAREAYEHPSTQLFVALVLLSNFIVNICETEVMSQVPLPGGNETVRRKGVAKGIERDAVVGDLGSGGPPGEQLKHPLQHAFDIVDLVYTCFYLFEVLWNLFGHWFWDFFTNQWSCFDLLVVLLSVVEVVVIDLSQTESSGPGVNVLRMLRVFRIFRIVSKMRSMKRITDAIQCSIKPVASAMLLSFVVLSIYAILGVNLFADRYPHADEYFGSYSLAFIGLLGIATGDSWTFEVRAMTSGPHLDWLVGLPRPVPCLEFTFASN